MKTDEETCIKCGMAIQYFENKKMASLEQMFVQLKLSEYNEILNTRL